MLGLTRKVVQVKLGERFLLHIAESWGLLVAGTEPITTDYSIGSKKGERFRMQARFIIITDSFPPMSLVRAFVRAKGNSDAPRAHASHHARQQPSSITAAELDGHGPARRHTFGIPSNVVFNACTGSSDVQAPVHVTFTIVPLKRLFPKTFLRNSRGTRSLTLMDLMRRTYSALLFSS
jgi:hypothetical protein